LAPLGVMSPKTGITEARAVCASAKTAAAANNKLLIY
jgi:hypothetical protein